MGGRLFTDKLVLRWLEGFGAWSLDSATPVTSAYPAHASGSSTYSLDLTDTRKTYRSCISLSLVSGKGYLGFRCSTNFTTPEG
jgi:hypothetical protein